MLDQLEETPSVILWMVYSLCLRLGNVGWHGLYRLRFGAVGCN